jgi:hypothetical protein
MTAKLSLQGWTPDQLQAGGSEKVRKQWVETLLLAKLDMANYRVKGIRDAPGILKDCESCLLLSRSTR